MALFGKKGKNATQADVSSPTSAENGAVTTLDNGSNGGETLTAVSKGKGKKVRAPKNQTPKKLKNGTVVGVNIGTNLIKAVEVTGKNGEITITAMGAVPTPPDSISNGVVMSVGALSEALKELWRTAGIKSKTVVSSVSGTGSLVVRVIEVPKMTDRELSDNMKVDADRYIPFPPTEVVMDFKALRELPSDPDNPNMDVLLAAAQREIIDLHIKAIQQARLDPRSIDVEPLAAARSLQYAQSLSGGSDYVNYNDVSAIVNIGATATEISVLRGDVLVFTRTVPGGGNAITQAIADGLGVHFTDAERTKVEIADALPPQGLMAPAAHDQFADEFADFGLQDDTQPISFDDFDTGVQNTGGGSSSDPFDMDIFNQGPNQNEPGRGHGQKEGDGKPDPFAFDFNFSNTTPPEADKPAQPSPYEPETSDLSPVVPRAEIPSIAPPEPVTAQAPGTGGVIFDFDDDSLLPSLEPDAPASAVPIIDDKLLPAVETSAASAPPVEPQGDAALPARSQEIGTVPSAFDFGDLDLPSLESSAPPVTPVVYSTAPTQSTTPVAAAPVTPEPTSAPQPPSALEAIPEPEPAPAASASQTPAPSPFSFSLSEDNTAASAPVAALSPVTPTAPTPAPSLSFAEPEAFAAPPAPEPTPAHVAEDAPAFDAPTETFGFDASPAPEAAPAAQATATSPAGEGEFDLDAIFGTTPSGGVAVDPTAAAMETDDTIPFDVGAPAPSGGFDVGNISDNLGDFGGGFGNLGGGFDDATAFNSFGAGLVEGEAIAGVDTIALYNAVHPALEALTGEVRRSLEFHLSRFPDATISRIALVGGGANLLNLDVYMTQMLGIPTQLGNPFTQLKVNAPKLPPDYAQDNGAICAVALGLALRDFVA